MTDTQKKGDQEEVKNLPLTNVIKSVAAAFIGVQSDANRKADFAQGKFSHFVIVALLGLALFITSLVLIVYAVLPD
ncbi:DUF2970 domain-containing protein [Thalassotalea aquiviva]|uniref:DUF2970 domain-containing protein n=1 Tax=Thalassotalea aquiviva TaxID=3242415 RepID=UPI00352ABC54